MARIRKGSGPLRTSASHATSRAVLTGVPHTHLNSLRVSGRRSFATKAGLAEARSPFSNSSLLGAAWQFNAQIAAWVRFLTSNFAKYGLHVNLHGCLGDLQLIGDHLV